VSGQTITIYPTKRGGFTRTLVHYEGTLVLWCSMKIHWCTLRVLFLLLHLHHGR